MGAISFNNLPEAIEALQRDMEIIKTLLESRTIIQKEEDQIFCTDEAAEFLGLQKQTIYQKVSDDEIPYMKQGKLLHFSKNELIAWLKSSSRKPKTEVA